VGPPYIAHLPADDDEGWPAWARAVCLRCFNIFTIQADLQKHLLECQAGKRRTSNKDGRTNFGPQWDSLFRAFCGDSRPEWERHPLAQHAQQSHRLRRVRRVSQIPRVQPDQQVQQVQQIQQVQQVQQIQQVQQGHPAQFWPIDPALQDSARQSAPQTYQAIFPPAVPTSLEGLLQGDESTKAYIVHLAAELADVRGELAIRDAALAKSQAEVAELKAVIDSLRAVKLRWFKEAQTANEAHGATERDQASPVPDILVDDSGLAAPPETISDDFPPQHITYESWLKVPHLHDKATSEFSDSTFAFEDDSPGKDNVQSENQITGDKIIFSDDEEQHLVSYRENECTDGLIDDASIIKGS
jgi:hypothetical protein